MFLHDFVLCGAIFNICTWFYISWFHIQLALHSYFVQHVLVLRLGPGPQSGGNPCYRSSMSQLSSPANLHAPILPPSIKAPDGPWVGPGRGPGRENKKCTHTCIYIYIYKATWIFADLYGFLLIVNVFVWLLHDLPWFLMLGRDFIHDDSIFNLNYVRIYFRHFGTLDLERWQAPKRKPWPKQNSPEQGVHKGFRDLLVLLQSPVQMQWCQAPAHTPEPQRKWENIVRADIRITAWGHNTSFHMQGERMRYKTIELPHAMRQQYL
jgi:hypothetical protein